MKELDAQKLVVQAVRNDGGFAYKASHRFLAGVPDLLIQHPDLGTSLWEVKIADAPTIHEHVELKATKLQKKWLKDYYHAGGKCGVMSFIRAKSDLFFKLVPMNDELDQIHINNQWWVKFKDHQILPRGLREQTIITTLKVVNGR